MVVEALVSRQLNTHMTTAIPFTPTCRDAQCRLFVGRGAQTSNRGGETCGRRSPARVHPSRSPSGSWAGAADGGSIREHDVSGSPRPPRLGDEPDVAARPRTRSRNLLRTAQVLGGSGPHDRRRTLRVQRAIVAPQRWHGRLRIETEGMDRDAHDAPFADSSDDTTIPANKASVMEHP